MARPIDTNDITAAVLLFIADVIMAVFVGSFFVAAAHAETCIASVYSTHDSDQNGTKTASGIRLDDSKPTVAHRTARLGSYLRVTHGGRSISVMVTDRGPFVRGRCVDLSRAAARQLGISGLGQVSVDRAR